MKTIYSVTYQISGEEINSLGLFNSIDEAKEALIQKTKGNGRKKEIKNYGDDTASFIVNVIKPLIDNTFKTKKEKQYTGFLGSSMGGIFSFHICTKFPKTFGFCGAFSPAFHIFRDEFNSQKVLCSFITLK